MNGIIHQFPSFIGSELLGGYIAALHVKRSLPVLHIGKGCADAAIDKVMPLIKKMDGLYSRNSSWIGEREIIFGGEEQLTEAITKADQAFACDTYIVLSNFLAETIGDDLERIAGIAGTALHKTVVALRCAGMQTDAYDGYDKSMLTLFKRALELSGPTVKKAEQMPVINVFGIVPWIDKHWTGNIRYLEQLANGLGFKLNYHPGMKLEFLELARVQEADLSIVLSEGTGGSIAHYLYEQYSIPYIRTPGYPIGVEAMEDFVLELARAVHLEPDRVERYWSKEKSFYYQQLYGYLTELSAIEKMTCGIIAGPEYTHGLVRFLGGEMGLSIPLNITVGSSHAEEGQDYDQVCRAVRQAKPGLLIGRDFDRRLAEEQGIPFVAVSNPSPDTIELFPHPMWGVDGALALLDQIMKACFSNKQSW